MVDTSSSIEAATVPMLAVAQRVPVQHQMAKATPSGTQARQALSGDELMSNQEQSPAYRALHENNLICTQYRKRSAADLELIMGNSTMEASRSTECFTCRGCCCLMQFFNVSAGCVRKARHGDGKYLFFGEGVHVIKSPFVSLDGYADIPLTTNAIIHGTRAIITVDQGFVGFALDRGQPVLLPPGLHTWNSNTLNWVRLIDLSSSVIRMGPYTLVTVDEGYSAVTQDNGAQKILTGGRSYMLTHRNWKFEKFMTQKLQTNDIGPITVTTGDNVPLETKATVNWRIENVQLAARMAANTMTGATAGAAIQVGVPTGEGAHQFDLTKLRQDVMRQVTASLAAFVGSVSYSSHGGTMSAQVSGQPSRKDSACSDKGWSKNTEPEPDVDGAKALFDPERLSSSVDHANEICSKYGVKILSINLISAYPADKNLLQALSQGAVATVAADQTEIAARATANSLLLKARAEAEAQRIRAEGSAQSEAIRAAGSLKAAKALEGSEVAKVMAKLRASGSALGQGKSNSFFFGMGGEGEMNGNAAMALMAKAATGQ